MRKELSALTHGFGLTLTLVLLAIPLAVAAGTLAVPNTFTNGTVADADEVNANFDVVETEVNDNDSRITAAQSTADAAVTDAAVAQSTADTAAVPQADNVLDLGTAAKQWKDLFLGGDLILSGGDVTFGGTVRYIQNQSAVAQAASFRIGGTGQFDGSAIFGDSATVDTVSFNSRIATDVIPNVAGRDLGDTSRRWSLFADGVDLQHPDDVTAGLKLTNTNQPAYPWFLFPRGDAGGLEFYRDTLLLATLNTSGLSSDASREDVLVLDRRVTAGMVGHDGIGGAILLRAVDDKATTENIARIGATLTSAKDFTEASQLTFATREGGGSLTDHVFIDGGGRVGIGIGAPDEILHVLNASAGTVTANSNSIAVFETNTSGFLSILTPDANERGILFGEVTDSSAGGIVYNNISTLDGLQFRTADNTTKMAIDSAGNVGIGTLAPTRLLDIQGATPVASLMGPSNDSNGGRVDVLEDHSGGVGGYIRYDGSLNDFFIGSFSTIGSDVDAIKIDRGNANVSVLGTLSKASGTFLIDHPLDPKQKVLRHSFVESPDMMNVYNGNAALDENGEATVMLPSYFGALNIDYRYQLTPLGQPALLYVKEAIEKNRFVVAAARGAERARVRFSWQVTGIRNDPFARENPVLVEEEKGEANGFMPGTYMHPSAYGVSKPK